MKYCSKCGQPLNDAQKFCKNCGYPVPSSILKKNSAKSHKGLLIIFLIILITLSAAGYMFRKQLKCEYYCYKADNSLTTAKKIEYSINALQSFNCPKSQSLVKSVFLGVNNDNLDYAESKLDLLSGMLSNNDYKSILTPIEEKKIQKLCDQSKYAEAVTEFAKSSKLGYNFKSNVNYDKIMLHTISGLTGYNPENSKSQLLSTGSVYYDNLDDDPFDEIISVKNDGVTIKASLYKLNNSKYELCSSLDLNTADDCSIIGVYDYVKGKKGIYITYVNTIQNTDCISVISANNRKLTLKGTVSGNYNVSAQDIDNDTIYELCSTSTKTNNTSSNSLSIWYKVNDDGSNPKEIKREQHETGVAANSTSNVTQSSAATAVSSYNKNHTNADAYLFPNSNTQYLTDNDVKDLSKDDLALARNELFARHGFVFGIEPFKSYFEGKTWYHKVPECPDDPSVLNSVEKENCSLIQKWEKVK